MSYEALFTFSVVLVVLGSLSSICMVMFVLAIRVFNYDLLAFFKITQRYFPIYRKLMSKYQVQYPCVMDSVYKNNTSFRDIKGIDDRQAYIFIKDTDFVIINRHDTNIYVEIPFESILYRNCSISGTYGERYDFYISLTYKLRDKEETFSFSTPYYHHKIDPFIHRLFPGLLNDENLYDFVFNNFISEEDYENNRRKQRLLERSRSHDDFFETSPFHKLTTIDAE